MATNQSMADLQMAGITVLNRSRVADLDVARKPLGTVIINLSLKGKNLEFECVEAEGPDGKLLNRDQTLEIMARRVLSLYDQNGSQWRFDGVEKKTNLGDLNVPDILAASNGKKPNDPRHNPIVIYEENKESLEWRIAGYRGQFLVYVTSDPHVDGLKGKPPALKNLFVKNYSAGTGPQKMVSPQYPNYVFFKYHVVLLEEPWATHDPDVICGTPMP
jgi:hypothetical protein